jgi:serine/threonine-protein kinase RsbW
VKEERDVCRIDLIVPSDPRVVAEIRRRFETFVRGARFSPQEVEDLKIAVSEACANAIRHGSPHGPHNQFRFSTSLVGDQLTIEIADEGHGFTPRSASLPPPGEFQGGGRGIFLMQRFCDSLEVEREAGGTVVRLRKRLPEGRRSAGLADDGGGIGIAACAERRNP